MVKKKGAPKPGEVRYLTTREFKISGLDCGMMVSVDLDGKIHFSRLSVHGYGKVYSEKDLVKSAKKLAGFWNNEEP